MKETNMERYRGEIEALDYTIGLCEEGLIKCGDAWEDCKVCAFYPKKDEGCAVNAIKWLMSEYKPEPVLTAREKHFVECLEDGWLTKGEACNEFKWWEKKPRCEGKRWVSNEATKVHSILSYAFGIKLPFITWEEEKPWSVEALRKLKVQE